MVPHRLIGGAVFDFPAAKLLALATLLGLVLTPSWHRLPRARELWLLAAFLLVCLASTMWTAFHPQLAWMHFGAFAKAMLMLLPPLLLMQEAGRLRAWVWTIALSLGGLGAITGYRAIATGLGERLFGPPGSVVGDNNALAFALAVALPMLVFLCHMQKRRWLAAGLGLVLVLTLIAVPATYSRGSFVVSCIALPATLVFARSLRLTVLVAATVLALVWVAPQPLEQRIATVRLDAPRRDASGAQRMKSWYVAARIGLDHPLLGAGFRPFSEDVYEHYLPGYRDYHNAHNHFLQVLAEHGFTGLTLFVALFVSVLVRLRALVRRTRADAELAWVAEYGRMLGLSLFAYIVGGVFINQPYFELLYWLLIAAVLLDVVAASPAAAGTAVVGESMLSASLRRLRRLV